jgi:flagellar FliJ protein
MPEKTKRLERIREYQERLENELAQELLKARTEHQRQVDKLEQIVGRINELHETDQAGLQVNDLSNLVNFLDKLEKNKIQQEEVVVRHEKLVKQAEDKLIEQRVEVKKYEKLIEKRKDAFRKEQQKSEQKELDEIALRLLK